MLKFNSYLDTDMEVDIDKDVDMDNIIDVDIATCVKVQFRWIKSWTQTWTWTLDIGHWEWSKGYRCGQYPLDIDMNKTLTKNLLQLTRAGRTSATCIKVQSRWIKGWAQRPKNPKLSG